MYALKINFLRFSNRKSNKFKLLLLISCCILILINNLLYYYNEDDLIKEIHENKLKAVQLLTERFEYKNWGIGDLGQKPFENCEEKRCYAFKPFRFQQKPLEKSDAVMVHVPNLFYMPSRSNYKRNPRQLWSFYTMESQKRSFCSSHYDLKDLDDWFNLTQTFKPSSDLIMDYKSFENWQQIKYYHSYLKAYKDIVQKGNYNIQYKNKKLAFWFVSHCRTPSRREDYVHELSKYIDIDIYGDCTEFKNSKPDPCKNSNNKKECYINLYSSYKFYLAFENSQCNDYITEKYWKIYSEDLLFIADIVPIVRGATTYQFNLVTNEGSFINANEFPSPKLLGEYLNILYKNNTGYFQYFKWKVDLYNQFENILSSNQSKNFIYRASRDDFSPFCQVCKKLHDEEYLNKKDNKRIKISEWFNPNYECRREDDPDWFLEKVAKFFGYCI